MFKFKNITSYAVIAMFYINGAESMPDPGRGNSLLAPLRTCVLLRKQFTRTCLHNRLEDPYHNYTAALVHIRHNLIAELCIGRKAFHYATILP